MRVPAADGLRGLAALLVMSYHVINAAGLPVLGGLRNFLAAGYLGVDFFFVISGFVLFLPVALAKGAFGRKRSYALRRAARILPAFYLAVIATALLYSRLAKSGPQFPTNPVRVWVNLALHLGFLQHSVGLIYGYAEGFGVNGAVWTLSIEVLFYALFPFIALWYYRRPFVGLGVALVLSTFWKLASVHDWIPLPHAVGIPNAKVAELVLITQFPTYLAHFGAGMTAAWIFVKFRKRISGRAWIVTVEVLALAGVIAGTVFLGGRDMRHVSGALDHWTLTAPVALCFALLLLAVALAPRWAQFPFRNPVTRWFGDISYGMYLWHLLFLSYALAVFHLTRDDSLVRFLKLGGFVLGGSVVAGAASHYLIERPCIRWARRISERRATAPRTIAAPGPAERWAPAELPVPVGLALAQPVPVGPVGFVQQHHPLSAAQLLPVRHRHRHPVPVNVPAPTLPPASPTVPVWLRPRAGNLAYPFMKEAGVWAAHDTGNGAAHDTGNGAVHDTGNGAAHDTSVRVYFVKEPAGTRR